MSIEKIGTHTQINSVSASNSQPLNFLKSIIGEGAVYKFVVRLFIGKQSSIQKSSVGLEVAIDSPTKSGNGDVMALLPPRKERRDNVTIEEKKGSDKNNILRKYALKIVDELLINVKKGDGEVRSASGKNLDGPEKTNQMVGKFILDRLENFFKNLEQYSPHLSDIEKEALHQLVASRFNMARDNIASYTSSPSAKLSEVLVKREEIKQKKDTVDGKFIVANIQLEKKMAVLNNLEKQRDFILKSIEILEGKNLTQLEQWKKASTSLIKDGVFLIGQAQKEIDRARANDDKNGVRTAQADIKNLQKLITSENKEILEPVREMLQDPTSSLNNLKEKLIKLEQDIQQYKDEQIRPIIILEAQRDADAGQLENFKEPLISLIDKEISGGLMTFLEGFEKELILKRDYPAYKILTAYQDMSPEELSEPNAGEMYRDYLNDYRKQLEGERLKAERLVPPDAGI